MPVRRACSRAAPGLGRTGLVLRDACPADKRKVLEFTRRTWGDYGDFIPRVWGRWIRDRDGRFIVAELDGVPVGIAKITDFGKGEFWLEGLRVSPEHRGKGIARAINVEVLASLAAMRPRAVRYCTGYTNWASRHIGGIFGFRIAGRFRYFWQKTARGRVRSAPARAGDAAEIYKFMRNSRFLARSTGIVGQGWVFRELTPSLLRNYVARGGVQVVRRRGALVGVALYVFDPNDNDFAMGFIDGDRAAIKVLARDCRFLGAARGARFCSVSVPTRYFPPIIEEAGFKRKSSMGQLVFELADPGSLARYRRQPAGGRRRQ